MLESPSDLMQDPASEIPIALTRESLAAHVALLDGHEQGLDAYIYDAGTSYCNKSEQLKREINRCLHLTRELSLVKKNILRLM